MAQFVCNGDSSEVLVVCAPRGSGELLLWRSSASRSTPRQHDGDAVRALRATAWAVHLRDWPRWNKALRSFEIPGPVQSGTAATMTTSQHQHDAVFENVEL